MTFGASFDRAGSGRGSIWGKSLRCLCALVLAFSMWPCKSFADTADDAADAPESVQAEETVDSVETAEGDSPFDGSGTAVDPFVIEDATDWASFVAVIDAQSEGYVDAYYSLEADIDLSSLGSDAVVGDGNDGDCFEGCFEGNEHILTVSIADTSSSTGCYVALFSGVEDATVRDLTVKGSVEGYAYVAGVVSKANGSTLVNLHNEAAVTVSGISGGTEGSSVAGVVNYCSASSVTSCSNSGTVTSNLGTESTRTATTLNSVGGVVGCLSSSSVSACYNVGTLTGNAIEIAGVVAEVAATTSSATASISDCYNRGSIIYTGSKTGSQIYLGGIAGWCMSTAANTQYLTIANCYSAGSFDDGSCTQASIAGIIAHVTNDVTDWGGMGNNYYLSSSSDYGIAVTYRSTYDDEETGCTAATEDELKAEGMAAKLGDAWADDMGGTQYNEGWPYLTWQSPETTYEASISVSLADTHNYSSDEISLVVTDSSGNDLSSQFTKESEDGSSSATWTISGVAKGTSCSYTLSKAGYESVSGRLVLDATDIEIAVELVSTSYSYSLTVSPTSADVGVTIDGAAATADAASEDGATATYVYEGLYNDSSISYSVAEYGYQGVSGTATLSFADGSDTVTLAEMTAYASTISVSASGASDVPTLVVWYDDDDDALLDDELVYDSREDSSAPAALTDGACSYGVFLVDGDYVYAVYLPGYGTQTGSFTVSGAGASVAVTLTAADAVWDGETADIGWYLFSDSETDYSICTADDMAGLSQIVGGSAVDCLGNSVEADIFAGATVHLEADIDLGGAAEDPSYWTPIGVYSTSSSSTSTKANVFAGTFDGEGHTISNLLVGSSSENRLSSLTTESGLFSTIKGTESAHAAVRDLTFKDAVVSNDYGSDGLAYGILAARTAFVDISDVDVVGGALTVDGTQTGMYAGGLVGYAYSSTAFSDCSNSASISAGSGARYVGGILGGEKGMSSYLVSLKACTNSGAITVSGTGDSSNTGYGAGGIVGALSTKYAEIVECVNTGDVSATLTSVGGIVGTSVYLDVISDCYNTGDISNNSTSQYASYRLRAGGIAGSYGTNSIASASEPVFINCYNVGAVGGSAADNTSLRLYSGGVVGASTVGLDEDVASNNYCAGDAEGTLATAAIGHNGTVSSGTDDVDITGVAEVMVSSDMKAASFVTTLNAGRSPSVWGSDATSSNDGYPILTWQMTAANQISESAYAWREAEYGTAPEGTEGTDGCHVTIELVYDGQLVLSDAEALVASLSVSGNSNLSFSADGVSVSEDGTTLVLEGDLNGALMAGVLTVSVAEGCDCLEGIALDGVDVVIEEYTTIPDSGLEFEAIEVVEGTDATCASTTYQVTSTASVRSMNHIIWMSNGASIIENTGDYSQSTTAHHYSYYSMTTADSAAIIVSNASDTLSALGYTLTDNGDGSFTIAATTAVAGEVLSAANYSSNFFNDTGIAYGEDVAGVSTPESTGHSYESELTAEPTCTATGTTTYTCSVCGDSYTEDVPATGHSYESSWIWADDCSTATVVLSCSACGDEQSVEGSVTIGSSDDGSTVYTAVATYDGVVYSDSQMVAAEEEDGDESDSDADGDEGGGSGSEGESEDEDSDDGSGDEEEAFLFDDVQNESSYYYEAVYALYNAGYITGYDETTYGVGDDMTRVQVVNILYRMAGEPATSYTATFSDVSSDKYYAEAVAWAYKEGVTTGTDEGEFLPNDSITRQEMFVMVARYINGGTDVAAADADGTLSAFKDAGEVNSYAEEAVAWCVENGLVTGTDSGEVNPQDELTREMGATVLYRGMDQILALSED